MVAEQLSVIKGEGGGGFRDFFFFTEQSDDTVQGGVGEGKLTRVDDERDTLQILFIADRYSSSSELARTEEGPETSLFLFSDLLSSVSVWARR